MTNLRVALLGLCAGLCLATLSACDDEGVRGSSFPTLRATPDPVLFDSVAVGDATSRVVTLENIGGGQLEIGELSLSNNLDNREFQIDFPELPIFLDAGETAQVRITYSPLDEGEDEGHLLVDSSDVESPQTRVRIVSSPSAAELLVDPDRLAFGQVPTGERESLTVTITNLGNIEVPVTSIGVSADTSPDFTVSGAPDPLPSIAQGEQMVVEVTYAPRGIDVDEGTLVITTGDPRHPQILVPMRGEEPSPDIHTEPEAVIFGALDPGDEAEQTLLVINKGNAPLTITAVTFGVAPPGVNEQFTLEGLPDTFPGEPLVLAPETQRSLNVRYHPMADGIHDTSIAFRSNDVDESRYTVPVRARVRRPCIQVLPVAVALGIVALGVESQHAEVNVLNCGELPLRIEDIALAADGAEGFHVENRAGGGLPIGAELQPLQTVELGVWFENAGLSEGEVAETTLTITNSAPDTPVIDVPITVRGGGAPSCDLLALPNRINYGLIARGSTRTRSVDILNRGTGHCDVTDQRITPLIEIFPGLPVPFILTRPLANLRLAPGQQLPVEVTYRPQVFSFGDSAKLVIAFHDPFRNEDRVAEATLSGVSGESNIEVIPERLDFGQVTARECASQTERVTVYNTGLVNLCINDVLLEGDACDEFFIVDRPVANADGCIEVTRAVPAEVRMTYEPADLGADECFLVFHSDASDSPELRVPLRGEGIRDREQVDEFVQTSGQTVDVLFVIDNSGSMQEEQDNLADNFQTFIEGADAFDNDFQIGVVTTDIEAAGESGKLQGDPRIMRRGPNVEDQFSDTANVGVNGAGSETGLEAAKRALSNPLAYDTGIACRANADCVAPDTCVDGVCGGFNRGFIREGAALVLVFLSDEEDQSPSQLDFYVDFFKNIKGFRNEAQFQSHVIVGADNNGRAEACSSGNGDAEAGRRYVEVADRTNGDVYSICDDSFGASLRAIGEAAFGLPVQFFLSRPALRNTVRVSVDGREMAQGWAYDEASNSIIFEQASVPQPGQRIRVEYEAQCFPRQE